jgi:phage gp36-like protein
VSTQYASAAEFRSFGLAAGAIANYTDAALDPFLQAASAWADGYLRSRYTLPLTQWSNDLKIAVCQYAKYLVLDHRGWNPTDPSGASVMTALKQAEKFWEDVDNGKRSLQVTDSSPAPRAAANVYSRAPRGW